MPGDVGLELVVEPGEDGIPHRPHAVGVGDRHRTTQNAAFLYPRDAGHVTETIARVITRENRVPFLSPRKHDRHAGADRLFSFSGVDRRLADLDAGDVGNGIERTGRPVERYSQVPRTRLRGLLA